MFKADMPQQVPNMNDYIFWDHVAEQQLCFQQCGSCDRFRHPPTPICGKCLSSDVRYTPTRGKGTIYSFTVIHHASHPAVAESLPYVCAVVEFDDIPGARLVTNVMTDDVGSVAIGQAVELRWDADDNGNILPRVVPA